MKSKEVSFNGYLYDIVQSLVKGKIQHHIHVYEIHPVKGPQLLDVVSVVTD